MKGNNLQPKAESCSKKTFVRTHLTTLCPTKNLVQLIARHNPHASSVFKHHLHLFRQFLLTRLYSKVSMKSVRHLGATKPTRAVTGLNP